MKKILFFVLAVLVTAGLTVAGCKKQEEVKPVPKAGQKKEKKATTTKKSTGTKSTTKKSSQKKGAAPESMM